ncbi:galactose mutarotase [Prochlorococcus marinus]|uniref:Galactose mutarotase n=1 Tax=Prochlorococcus marinus XMU1408 TaxID=2213228 RepID=A0A318QWL7_PROMR|nr:galactose mutarotase [Prochlorococcus marinus]MBW3042822.1 galactose mutarotase [Prochlorococcus marinus str. XMU1408]PYE00649.1 galactose mutarotase [Prochlorococcus marinus XMU1408]
MTVSFLKKTNPYPHWEYSDSDFDSLIRIVPERGGLITEWQSEGKELLYFDLERFLDKDKSVRGGIPILFPICGDLSESYLIGGKKHSLKQHGFARDLPWSIDLLKDELGIRLKLSDTKDSRSCFPFFFTLLMDVCLKEKSLQISVKVYNQSQDSMPFSFGLHPYFHVSNTKKIKIDGLPEKCIDQTNMKVTNASDQIKILDKGVDFLCYPSRSVKLFDCLSRNLIELIHQEPMDTTVIWTDPPRQMVCLEPWTSPRNSLVTGDRKLEIKSEEYVELFTTFKHNSF